MYLKFDKNQNLVQYVWLIMIAQNEILFYCWNIVEYRNSKITKHPYYFTGYTKIHANAKFMYMQMYEIFKNVIRY